MSTICTSDECIKCIYCTLEDESKSKLYINCSQKDKKYFFGQMVSCDNFKKDKEKQEELQEQLEIISKKYKKEKTHGR